MVLPPPPVMGSVIPAILARPPYASLDSAVEALQLGASMGLHADPAQQLVVECMLAVNARGKWAALEVGELMARQNGKGLPFDLAELHALFVLEDELILHSAHLFATALKAFQRMEKYVENWDFLRRRVKRINRSHGEEGIELMHPTQMIQYMARQKNQGRGFTAERLFLDEAQDLPVEAMAAVIPTLSARSMIGNPQILYAGTVPAPGERAAPFTSVRDRGRAAFDNAKGVTKWLAWLEWSSGRELPRDVDERMALTRSRDLWAASNPALGVRISEDFLEAEIDMFVNDETKGLDAVFREIVLIWPDGKSTGAFTDAQWKSLGKDPESRIVGRKAFGLDAPPDQRYGSISVAGLNADGIPHTELVARFPGIDWIPDWFLDNPPASEQSRLEKNKPFAIVYDSASPIESIHDRLAGLPGVGTDENARTRLHVTTTKEFGAACGHMISVITKTGQLRHRSQTDLNNAVASTSTRPLGDALAFAKRGASDIAPMVASTLAVYEVINKTPPVSVYETRGLRVLG